MKHSSKTKIRLVLRGEVVRRLATADLRAAQGGATITFACDGLCGSTRPTQCNCPDLTKTDCVNCGVA